MAVQTIDTGRPACRPTPSYRVVLTARAHGYLDAVQGRAARPAPFARQGGQYLAGYLLGIATLSR